VPYDSLGHPRERRFAGEIAGAIEGRTPAPRRRSVIPPIRGDRIEDLSTS